MGKLKVEELLILKDIDCNVPYYMSWDIETSKIKADNHEDEIQVVFLSNLLCVNANTGEEIFSIFHRSIKQFVNFVKELRLRYKHEDKIIIYAHNLDYELSFLLREIGGNGVLNSKSDDYGLQESVCILRDTHNPLSIELDTLEGVVFKDSYALFNKSVKELGNDLIKRGFDLPKLDYEYNVTRLSWDKLKDEDYEYNKRDNEIVCKSLYLYRQDNNLKWDKLPLTFTGATKNHRYNFINEHFGGVKSLCIDKIDSFKSYDFYDMTLKAYQGGLTTSHYSAFNKLNYNVWSADFKSSYPTQMCTRKFPIFLNNTTHYFKNDDANNFYHDYLHLKTHEQLLGDISNVKGYYVNITIENIEIKDDNYLLPLSAAFCTDISKDAKVINGKVYKASRVDIMCNNITLEWINMCYFYENIDVYELYTTTKSRYLRLEEVAFILNAFEGKETINKLEHPLEYNLAKVIINACYGIKVQKPIKDRNTIIDGEVHKLEFKTIDDYYINESLKDIGLDINKEKVYNNFIEREDKSKKAYDNKSFDIFTDGGYITEFARYSLLKMMVELTNNGFLCIYADTDSLKFKVNGDITDVKGTYKELYKYTNCILSDDYTKEDLKVIEILGEYNKNQVLSNRNNIRFKEYKDIFNIKPFNYDKICKLGILEIESTYEIDGYEIMKPYTSFKTLGAKKYAYVGCEVSDNQGLRDFKYYISTTIAGCSTKVKNCIEKYANVNNTSYSDAIDLILNEGTLFDKSCSGRTIAKRETRDRDICKKLTYKNRALNSMGGIVIEETTYLLNISEGDCCILGDNHFNYEEPILTINSKGEVIFNDGKIKKRRSDK